MLPTEGFDVRSVRNRFRGERDVLFGLGFHQQPKVFSGEPFHIFATARESTELDTPMLERVHFRQNHLFTFDECLVQRSDDRLSAVGRSRAEARWSLHDCPPFSNRVSLVLVAFATQANMPAR